MKPPEKVIPILTFRMCIVMKDRPANTACTANSSGATNRNENSSGSVIPVRKEVRAAEIIKLPTTRLFSGLDS
ncbi:hypothetical protein D3C81_2072690 [compost metagenome]